MKILGDKIHNKHDKTYSILIRVTIPEEEVEKIKEDKLYIDYIDKKFKQESYNLFLSGLYNIINSIYLD